MLHTCWGSSSIYGTLGSSISEQGRCYNLILPRPYYLLHASILFIVRNPLDSIASIYSGKTLKPGSLKGAISYWNESYYLYKTYKKSLENIFLVKYEDFAYNPNKVFLNLLNDLCPNVKINNQDNSDFVKKPNIGSYLKYLNKEEAKLVFSECEEGLKHFKYN